MRRIGPKNSKKGFSLVEILVAVGVFSIIIIAVVYVFGRSSLSFKSSRYIQRDLESAQFALNLMAKSLRTSSVISPTGMNQSNTTIRIFDYSQSRCIQYQFLNNALQTRSAALPAGMSNPVLWCDTAAMPAWSEMAGSSSGNAYLSGNFFTTNSNPPSSPRVGKVTVSLRICSTPSCAGSPNDQVRIQSTVSLRDYNVSSIY